ncbi:hypothetical protein [Halorussus ruber]|uniref:hypothetical protein n=1 Tax=Halorussus ruber TaxID=1126238 RepID=UPI001B2FE947|nr:hypothetical protein [Halorussus ruber]
MSGESTDSGDGDRGDRPDRSDKLDRGGREEPLGDLAAEVRSRTGDRPASERPDAPEREGPLADVASAVDERRRKRTEGTDPFESVEVGELDGEKLWEQLAEGDDDSSVAARPDAGTVADAGTTGDAGTTTDAVGSADVPGPTARTGDDRDVRTISKDTCHGCPHFGDPPELACTHEEADILAMPDSDHFRVADCPMAGGDDEDIGTIGVESDAGDDS